MYACHLLHYLPDHRQPSLTFQNQPTTTWPLFPAPTNNNHLTDAYFLLMHLEVIHSSYTILVVRRVFNALYDWHVDPQGDQEGSDSGTFSYTLFDFALRLQPVYEGGQIELDGSIPFYLKTGDC